MTYDMIRREVKRTETDKDLYNKSAVLSLQMKLARLKNLTVILNLARKDMTEHDALVVIMQKQMLIEQIQDTSLNSCDAVKYQ